METKGTFIHPSAVVHKKTRLDYSVRIGPACVIGPDVSIGKKTCLDGGVHISGVTEIGEENRFWPHSVIGAEPQDLSYKGEPTRVVIGDRNIFREFMTVHRGTPKDKAVTRIGSNNYFMAYSHIGHDCQVGDHVVFINGATLGGHCAVDDYAQVGSYTGVHPFCRIGKYAFTGGFSVLTRDLVPFCRVAGSRPPLLYGVNSIGLLRNGFSKDKIKNIKTMYKLLFFSGLNTSQAMEKFMTLVPEGWERNEMLSFVRSSKRGIIKKAEPGAGIRADER
ncbi:MAG: acyl-ACP--UDP-N-acetylglucosamine O-acyltransferase [Candidatus Aminicenantes bacterium]